jgi:adenosylmethionine-8-amino-7-oxononanoate aminotransferase
MEVSTMDANALKRDAMRHLWLHFTAMGSYASPDELQVIVRGEGSYVWDADDKRYLDGLSGLFCSNIGYSHGEEIGEAAKEQLSELPFYSNWTFAHPRAIELATEVASLAPGDLNRVFFVSGGSEAVEAAWKLARQYHAARGERRWKVIGRRVAYHGTTMGALSITNIPSLTTMFEPLVPDTVHVSNTGRFHRPPEETEAEFTAFLLRELEETIEAEGADTIAMVIMEPVQNAGGSFTPPAGYFEGVRKICDQHGILLVADETITAWGRVGHWFASERYGIQPDVITTAKGLSSAHTPIGAMIASDRVVEPFMEGDSMYSHGMTFGGHPVSCAIALKNLEIMKREGIPQHVLDSEAALKEALAPVLELPIAGELRGDGFFLALELTRDKETHATFTEEEGEVLLRGFLSPRLFDAGLICRADDRGDPVVQLSPPLVAEQAEFDFIAQVLGEVLQEAGERMEVSG